MRTENASFILFISEWIFFKKMPFPTNYCLAAYLLVLFLEENGKSLLLMQPKQISLDFLSEIF